MLISSNEAPTKIDPGPKPFFLSPNLTPEKKQRLERMRKLLQTKTADEFKGDEKAQLSKNFVERYKPAVEKWCKAYEGRVPFKLDDVTLDNFVSRLGGPSSSQYMFKVKGYTLAVMDDPEGARVSYLANNAGMKALNAPPTDGGAPDISVPVTKADVLRMAQADTGATYQINQINITPTGAASSINGGAYVDVNKKMTPGGEAEIMTGGSISMVFSADGKLISYIGPFNLGQGSKGK